MTAIPMIGTRKEAIEITKTTGTSKNDKEDKSKYLENLAWVLCIWYPIIFQKKSVPYWRSLTQVVRSMLSTEPLPRNYGSSLYQWTLEHKKLMANIFTVLIVSSELVTLQKSRLEFNLYISQFDLQTL